MEDERNRDSGFACYLHGLASDDTTKQDDFRTFRPDETSAQISEWATASTPLETDAWTADSSTLTEMQWKTTETEITESFTTFNRLTNTAALAAWATLTGQTTTPQILATYRSISTPAWTWSNGESLAWANTTPCDGSDQWAWSTAKELTPWA